MDDIGYWCSVASDLLAIDRQVMLYLRACHMIHDPYAVCLECGKTYHVCEGHNCEYGTYVPPVDSVRCTVEDQDGDDVEITVKHG
jgi:hypothetical protein